MFSTAQVDANRVAVYIRWSTEEQGSGTTLEVQRDACRHFIKSQGWAFRDDLVFVDDGYSGGSLRRPALAALRSAVGGGQVCAVVVYKLDRLSRNLMDCVNLVRQEWSGVALFSTMERFDTQSSIGQMVFNILVSFAEFERNLIRERTMSGKRKRREQGRNPGMQYPYGYRKGVDGGFAIAPAEGEVVRQVFAEYLSGSGLTAISDRLNRQGISAPRGGLWRRATLRLMLQNPIYAGHLPGGYYSYDQGRQKRGKAPAFLLRGAVPPLIRQSDFDRAQSIREDRAEQKRSPDRSSDYLLTTILRCAKCGGPMSGQNGSDGRRYYRCANQKDLKTCDSGIIPKALIEQEVLRAVRDRLSPENLRTHIRSLEEHREQHIAGRRSVVEQLSGRLADLQMRREKVDLDYLTGAMEARQHGRLMDRLEAEISSVVDQLERARAACTEAEQSSVDLARLLALAGQIEDLAAQDPMTIRSILRQLVASLTVYRERGRHACAPIDLTIAHNVEFLTRT
ncbi:MAG TPA: recombinase family protein [Symbiobacteriaceae bacterium]|nr:recombinase family protein [Symbiobacteriaceae bacterium]